MNTYLDELQISIKSIQNQLYTHSLYQSLTSIHALKTFMSFHVFAVWDFMNLLASLQSTFTQTQVPWVPPKNPQVARLINQIKLEEESDLINGQVTSHFEFYCQAMRALGCDTGPITTFTSQLDRDNADYENQLSFAPEPVRPFLMQTHSAIVAGPAAVAASFTFGRETIIPTMFHSILSNTATANEASDFIDYLNRHIELDGDEHSVLAMELVAHICGDDPLVWAVAKQAATDAIISRIQLYSMIEKEI